MGKIAIVYWSGTGNTENMAHAVADGARKGGASSVDEVTADQFSAADVEKPMWDEVKDLLGEKKTVLFGSYGWGTGEWMDSWREDAGASGVHVVETAIANNEPDDEALETCRKAGEALI